MAASLVKNEEDKQVPISFLNNLKKFFVLEEDRLKSFDNWPFANASSCSKLNMAQAGFYWTGTKQEPDTATCFVCNKTLDGWEETDDPWKEHAKHAPQCEFVKYGKKQSELTVRDFINIMGVMIKNKMVRDLEKTKCDFRNLANKAMESYVRKNS